MIEVVWLIVKKTHRLCWIQIPTEKGYIMDWHEDHTKGLDHGSKPTNYIQGSIEI